MPKNMYLLPGNVAQCSGGAGQMLEMLHPRNMEYRPKQIQVNFTPFWCNLKDDLWKSGCCDLDSERKKFSQAQMTPWHVLSSIWVHFGLWWLIFVVKNRFSHIFPASAWSPYQSLFLRYEVEKGLRAVYPGP